ncbi:hypothetical protein EMCG_01467 [[Emmonsia] crescens]|uniref:Uncharacterized protein n=1 Tax=[Emmonsia] crescens TaxID=73230 RepID=A0A0G2J2L8_9EURO|nr:hypothetical protein EMCG_01467 [Emmonsia crescens UAMH 3008]
MAQPSTPRATIRHPHQHLQTKSNPSSISSNRYSRPTQPPTRSVPAPSSPRTSARASRTSLAV